MADLGARLLARKDEIQERLQDRQSSQSLLDNLVRVKLAHLIKPGDPGERIVLYEHLNDERHLTELGLTTEQAVELQFAVVLGKMKASSFEGYILEERQYREIRAAGWHNLLW